MRRLLGVLLSFGMAAAFCGCTGGDAKAPAASDTSAANVAVASSSSAKVAQSVEMVYFGSPGWGGCRVIAPGLEALKEAAAKSGLVYRKGERSEASKYNFKYIPHMVFTDSSGKELYKLESSNLMKVYKDGNFVETLVGKAKELSGK